MARLISSGFELNSNSTGVELTDNINGGISIATSPVRSGTYAAKISSLASGTQKYGYFQYASSNSSADTYVRFYLYITSYPNVNSSIGCFATTGNSVTGRLRLSTTGTLSLLSNNSTVIGTSSALNTGQWYRIEHRYFSSSTTQELKIDGSLIASSSSAQSLAPARYYLGGNLFAETATAINISFDDIAINNTTGSFQNSYPGDGSIIHQRPAGAGDSTQWTPDTGSNYARVNEVTPDDATSLVSESILNKSDFYAVGSSSLGAGDTVNVVSVGGRFNNDTADATTSFQFQIEKTSGGTVSKSSAIVPNSTVWKSNALANPWLYPITLYQDPDSGSWTKTTIESMQIGVLGGVVGVNKIQVSTVWALVDYTPGVAVTGATPSILLTGYGA